MPYSIRLPDGTLVDGIPDEVTPEQAKARILASRPDLMPRPKEAPFSASDLALSLGQGAIGGVKALTDVFGAGNVASEFLERGQQALGEAMTPERRAEQAAQQQRMKEAEQKGAGAEFVAALQNIKEAPLQSTAQAVGSFLPFVATSAVGLAAKLLPSTMRAMNVAVGAAQGAGAVKGSIYDSVKAQLMSEGMPEDLAEKQAQAAQAYTGKNAEQIGLGTVLGGVAGGVGAERFFTKAGAQAAPAGFTKRVGQAAVGEALPEAAQGGQERMAANIALQREGFDVPTFRGVAGAATEEGVLGGLGGAAVASVRGPEPVTPPAPAGPPVAAPTAAPVTAPPTADVTRPYAELWQQREQLRSMPQTPEAKAAIAALTARINQLDAEQIQGMRDQRRQEREDERKARGSAFSQPGQQVEMREAMPTGPLPQQLDLFGKPVQAPVEAPAVRPLTPRQQTIQDKREAREAGQMQFSFRYTKPGEPTSPTPTPAPAPGGFTLADIEATGVPFKTAQDWFTRNVVGKTKEEVAALVQQDPTLVKGQGYRAKILRTLLGPDIPAFKEPTRGKPTAPRAPAEPAGDQRGVGVPSAPPVTGGAPTAPAPQGPVTGGVAPTPPAPPTGTTGEGQQPGALTPDQIKAKAEADAAAAAAAAAAARGRKKVAPREPAPPAPPVAPPAVTPPAAGPAPAPVPPTPPAPPPVGEKPPVAPPVAPVGDTRTAADIEAEIEALRNKQRGLLLASGKKPMPKSKARKAYDDLEAQIQTLIPQYDAKYEDQRKRDAEEMERGLKEIRKRDAEERARKTERAPAPPAAPKVTPPTPPLPESRYEPIGIAQGVEEGEDDIRRGPQAELFSTGKTEARKRAEAADEERKLDELDAELRELEERQKAQPRRLMRPGQLELPLMLPAAKRPPSRPLVPAPAAPAAPAEPSLPGKFVKSEADIPAWAKDLPQTVRLSQAWSDSPAGAEVAYVDGDFAVIRSIRVNASNMPVDMRPVYRLAVRDPSTGRVTVTRAQVDSVMPSDVSLSDTQLLQAEVAANYLGKLDRENAKKYPDGPFTGTTNRVVKTDSIDQRYADYVQGLLDQLGLKDVRIFLMGPKDVDNAAKYNLYGEYYGGAKVLSHQTPDTNGATRRLKDHDHGIVLKEGMGEALTLEILAHEFGHMVQKEAFDTAPQAVQAAVMDEYYRWLENTKKKDGTFLDLLYSLRNRQNAITSEAALRAQGPRGERLLNARMSQLSPNSANYWLGFSEWFADNVGRWATTSEKPLSITERFFASVAQKMRDLLKIVTGRTYLPAKSVKDFLDNMGSATFTPPVPSLDGPLERAQFNLSYGSEQIIEGMGPLEPEKKPWYRALYDGIRTQSGDPTLGTKFRVLMADSVAAVEQRVTAAFNGAVRDALGNLNPLGLLRQAQDYTKLLPEYFQRGAIKKDPITGLWEATSKEGVPPPIEVFDAVNAWSDKNGYTREGGMQRASRVLESARLREMLKSNRTQGTNFFIHMKEPEIDTLTADYDADPDLQAISALMDEARIDMVDNLVAVGRLSKDEGDNWKSVVNYVPFDRINDETSSFDLIKKLSGKGVAQLGKLPELKGSLERPVGNVFTNYMNTLGWMIRQTTNADATTTTLKVLEGIGAAKSLGKVPGDRDRTVGAYVNGELRYWELPSRYDLMAFKDLTLPKSGHVKLLSAFSNVLRKTVTALPPFALKQVADDVQRAIFTSGVRNPGPMIRMALTNFAKLSYAELRGIRHPIVEEFGALGLTGEYDFQQGRPAESILKDLGYVKRGRFENILHKLDGITRASDLAVRKAIFDQTMKENNDRLLAQTRAREFINFRRRGASNFAATMTATIPFFNAYIQGMDVLYRAATGQAAASSIERNAARKLFWSRATMLTAFATMYALGKSDDDDYKEMDLRTRDSNWILGSGFKIGVPTELGAIFKVIPERMVEYYKRKGTPEEQEAFEAVRTALAYISEQYIGRAMPIPQAYKPLLEAFTNYSFLTGRPLEGIFQKGQVPSERRTATTSELAIQIAQFAKSIVPTAELSPILIDNVLRGYFGSTAALVTMTTDSMLNPTRVDRPLHKYALLSNYLYDPVGTRRMSEFYEEREKVGQLNATLNELAKTNPDKAEAFALKHDSALQLERGVNATLEQLERTRAYRKYLNSPLGAEDMPKDARERELEEVRRIEADLVGWLREVKTEIRRNPLALAG